MKNVGSLVDASIFTLALWHLAPNYLIHKVHFIPQCLFCLQRQILRFLTGCGIFSLAGDCFSMLESHWYTRNAVGGWIMDLYGT